MAADAASAMGSIALWSFSPAIDFSVEDSDSGALDFWNSNSSDKVNVLFAGVPDLCHIVQNLPEALTRTDRPINFYVLENSVEVYARQLLLLWLLCEPPDSVGLQEKVWMFLEIVGNTLVRPSTARYITETSTKLIELVTGGDDCDSLPLVSLTELRHRERDQLAAVFHFWRTADSKIDVLRMWDLRLRQQLARRYDARHGVFDWDYFMRLKDRLNIEFVQPEEYKHWRETGVAFRRPGTEQTCANRTLVTTRALGRPGERQLRRGFWGDIVSSPYAPFGLRSGDPSLSRKQNGRLAADAAAVSAANLEALLSGVSSSLLTAGHVRVRLLPADGGAALARRAVHRQRFSAAVFSSGMSHLLTPSVAACLCDGAPVLLETARYIVCVSAEQQWALLERYAELADTAGCRPLGVGTGGGRWGVAGAGHRRQTTARPGGPRTVKEEGNEQVSETGPLENSGRLEDKLQSTAVDSNTETCVEAVSPSIKESAETVTGCERCISDGITENRARASITETTRTDLELTRNPAERNCTAVNSAEGANVGDQPSTIFTPSDQSKDSISASSGDRNKSTGSIENSAGDPKASENFCRDATQTMVEHLGESQLAPDAVPVTRQNGTISEGARRSGIPVDRKAEKVPESCGRQLANQSGTAPAWGDVGADSPPSGPERAGARRWASDKLTTLPEWVCYVKRRAGEVGCEPPA